MLLSNRCRCQAVLTRNWFASHGSKKLRGKMALPKTENDARKLLSGATARLKTLTAKADELARSRASDERKAMDLSRLLVHWMINGKPCREKKQPSGHDLSLFASHFEHGAKIQRCYLS
jgi:hypothetical protein